MKIQKILEQTIPGLGYELVDVELTPARIIKVFVDKEGGVTVDDCAEISEHLSRLFMVEEIDYNRLEVSSPGLERPLRKLEDFIRFVGETVKVKTHEIIDGQKVFQGIIKPIVGKSVQLELANGNVLAIDWANINRARLVFEIKKGNGRVKSSKA